VVLLKIFHLLLSHFGKQNWWPVDLEYHRKHKTAPFDEIVIGAILTQNTSWKNVEKALNRLKEKGKLSLEAILETPIGELEKLIKPAGFYKQKARYLKEVAKFIKDLNGDTPKRGELLKVKGIGKETADVILLYAYNVPSFVIDKYTLRWLERFFGLKFNYEGAKSFFEENLPKDLEIFKEFHALLDELAKNYCLAKKPKCEMCPLKATCKKKGV